MAAVKPTDIICCPSCGNRVLVSCVYVCNQCFNIYCMTKDQCGSGFPNAKCPLPDCGKMGARNFEDLVRKWMESEPEARSTNLSLDEWILRQAEVNLEKLSASLSVEDALLQASHGLPFGLIPSKWTPVANRASPHVASNWSALESRYRCDRGTWPRDALEQVIEILRSRLLEVLAIRRPPTADDVSMAVHSVERDLSQDEAPEAIVSASRAIDVTRQWLVDSAAWNTDVVSLCSEAVGVITAARDRAPATFEEMRTFIEHARGLWNSIQWLLLGEVEYCWITGNESRAIELEIQLLEWLEQFENRVLVAELRLVRESGGTGRTSLGPSWEQGGWAFSPPWGSHELGEWSSDGVRDWLDEHGRLKAGGASHDSHPLGIPYCLGYEDLATGSQILQDSEGENSLPVLLTHLGVESQALEELIPEGCIWIRALFDHAGCLRWSAWINERESLTRLATGESSPGAAQRLENENQLFDQTTASAWENFRDSKLRSSGSNQRAFRNFTQAVKAALEKQEVVREPGQCRRETTAALLHLREVSPALAQSGTQLLEWLLGSPEQNAEFPQACWVHWHADAEHRRRLELDAASQKHLAALAAEWNLSALRIQDAHDVDWQSRDILFQVQGPLLAMPLAWLDFGGAPVFEQVASTSTAVSLTMRQASLQRVGSSAVPHRRLLSMLWDEPQRRQKSFGLPLIHAAARRLATEVGWEAKSLGDEPRASASNLCRALEDEFGVVLIGAHGVSRAGIKLADDVEWCGEAADLSEVDLLVLCCCAVGRLTQNGIRDVEGLYSRLAVHGARCVVAARWPIADLESAILLGEFLKNYLAELEQHGEIRPFARARAFNQARVTLLRHRDVAVPITAHLASAFDIYGLG